MSTLETWHKAVAWMITLIIIALVTFACNKAGISLTIREEKLMEKS